jgi:threonine/homoserine/homoserine lactone efflux protein
MTVPGAVVSFALVAGLLTIVPGLDTALVLRGTLARSRSYGFAAIAGIQVGVLAWGAAAASGTAALLAASHTAYRVLTIAGAGYMIWLGLALIRRTLRGTAGGGAVEAPPEPGKGRARGFAMGLGTNLMNPKVGAFYIAVIPQFLPHGVSPLAMGLLLAGVHCVLGLIWLSAVVLGAGALGPRLRNAAVVRWIDRVTGGVLVAFGLRLAVSPGW